MIVLIAIVYLLVGMFLAGLFDDNPSESSFYFTVLFWPLKIVVLIAAVIGASPYRLGQWIYDRFLKRLY